MDRRFVTVAQPTNQVSDNIHLVARSTSRVHLRNTATTTPATGTATAISFDTEVYDTDGMHAGGAPTRITIVTAGVYGIGGNVEWADNATGIRRAPTAEERHHLPCDRHEGGDGWCADAPGGVHRGAVSSSGLCGLLGSQNSGSGLDISVSADYSPRFFASWRGST